MCNIYLCGFFVCICATPCKLFSVSCSSVWLFPPFMCYQVIDGTGALLAVIHH